MPALSINFFNKCHMTFVRSAAPRWSISLDYIRPTVRRVRECRAGQ